MTYEMVAGQRGQQLLFSSMAELVPLTQSLIPASLAQAFGIPIMEAGFGMSSAAAMPLFPGFSVPQPQAALPSSQNPPSANYGSMGASVRELSIGAPPLQLHSGPSSSFATNNRSTISSHPAPSHTLQSQQVSFSSGRNAEADRVSNQSGSYASPSSTLSNPPVYPSAQNLPFHQYAQTMLAAAQPNSGGYSPTVQGPYFQTTATQNPMVYYGRDPSAYPMVPPTAGPHGYNQAPSAYQGAMYDYSAMPAAYRGPPPHAQQYSNPESNDDEYNDDGTRAVKRPRLVWTPQLHKKFEVALNKLGPDKAVPKNIMQEMNIDGLTRENVASHLQKYRMLRKKGDDGSFGSDASDMRSDSAGQAPEATKDKDCLEPTAQGAVAPHGDGNKVAQPLSTQPVA